MLKTKSCPICDSTSTRIALSVHDFSVSHEQFALSFCRDCNFLFTSEPPSKENIGPYYKSEDYISHTDSSKGLFNRIYQAVRRYTLSSKRKIITKFLKQKESLRLLDYGCGTGAFLRVMQTAKWDVSGIEPDEQARFKAAAIINKQVYSPEKIFDFNPGSFEVVTLWHVLEHVHDLHETLAQLGKLLTNNGLMLIAVPNHFSLDANHYIEKWAAYDVPRHLYHFNPNSLEKLLRVHGLKIVKILPMWFDAFYVSLLSEKYKTGKMRIIPAIFYGLLSNLNAIFNKGTCSSQIYVVRKAVFNEVHLGQL